MAGQGLIIPKGLITQTSRRSGHPRIQLDYRRFGIHGKQHVTERAEFMAVLERSVMLHELLEGKDELLTDKDVVMTGWKTESPYVTSEALDAIQTAANALAAKIQDFWSDGIGGSYLGINAAIDAICGSLDQTNLLPREARGGAPRIFFAGHLMDPAYTVRSLQIMAGRQVGGNVISKSGGTVEPAIAFAILRNTMEKSYAHADVVDRIIAITDKIKGALKDLSDEQGYLTFVVPDNVGGRYSVTCPVGLFALAVAGVDIKSFVAGAKFAEEDTRKQPAEKNIAMLRAAMRFTAHKYMGIDVELASTGAYDLRNVTMWMNQLGPESEGKNGEGLFIVPQYFTREAHADGQLIQQGKRNLMETFLMVEDPGVDVKIPGKGTPVDYLDGKSLHATNTAFVEGLRDAHYEGGVPTMSYVLPRLDAFTIGALFQYEMNAIALSALLLGQKPFIQPGVQDYKDIADARSGKKGKKYDAIRAQIKAAEKKLDPRFIV
jgi:glucose-6-phosphate isomerase